MKKERSKIIIDLIRNNIDVLQALQSLDLMLEDINDKEIKDWVNKELNGYDVKDKIPKYRCVTCVLKGDIQIGYNIYYDMVIPLTDKELSEKCNNYQIIEPISVVKQYSIAENEIKNHSLSIDTNVSVVDQYSATSGEVIRAHRELSMYSFNNVLSIIKDKLLKIFKLLEDNYGNLDNLYIDFSDKEKEKKSINQIFKIIYNE